MPYKLKPIDDYGYKVQSLESEKYLSKKPLTKAQAKKQMMAVSLSEGLIKPTIGARKKVKGGDMPAEKTFYVASRVSYHNPTNPKVDWYIYFDEKNKGRGTFKLLYDEPNVKIFIHLYGNGIDPATHVTTNKKNKNKYIYGEILIACRGSKDAQDWEANLGHIPFNTLNESKVYNLINTTVKKCIEYYPPSQFEYYITGHSLGGGLATQFKRDYPFILDAYIFNPASQPIDFDKPEYETTNRVYDEGDPLYNLGIGHYSPHNFKHKKVLPNKTKSLLEINLDPRNWANWWYSLWDYGNYFYNYYESHMLKNKQFIKEYGEPEYYNPPQNDVIDTFSGGVKSNSSGQLHAIIFKKPVDMNYILAETQKFINKKKPFMRETNTSVRVRNIPKTKFIPKSFRTKKINSNISLVYGELKQ